MTKKDSMSFNFLAIDFETANYASDSACAIGAVRVLDGKIIEEHHHLIRPPSKTFTFTHIHKITWNDVKAAPSFEELWPKLQPMFKGVDFVVAHNVGFDRNVLLSCCDRYSIDLPEMKYECTVRLARRHLKIFPTNLPAVCKRLKIPLDHHNAMSDALACAKIALAALSV